MQLRTQGATRRLGLVQPPVGGRGPQVWGVMQVTPPVRLQPSNISFIMRKSVPITMILHAPVEL